MADYYRIQTACPPGGGRREAPPPGQKQGGLVAAPEPTADGLELAPLPAPAALEPDASVSLHNGSRGTSETAGEDQAAPLVIIEDPPSEAEAHRRWVRYHLTAPALIFGADLAVLAFYVAAF